MRLLVLLLMLCGPAYGSTWNKIADERGAFTIVGTKTVRYGAGSAWVEKAMTGAGVCDNVFFGRDPINGVVKQCQVAEEDVCLPSDIFPGASGTPYLLYETPKVSGRVGWCKLGVPVSDASSPTGWTQLWRPRPYQWCVRSKCSVMPAGMTPLGIVDSVRAGATAAAAAASAVSIKAAAGGQDEHDFKVWWSRACKFMTTKPYPSEPPSKFAPGFAFAADYCPAEPTALPPVVWQTPAAGTFTIYTHAAGKLTGLSPTKATPNAACIEPCPMFKSGTKNLCALQGGKSNEVTECTMKP